MKDSLHRYVVLFLNLKERKTNYSKNKLKLLMTIEQFFPLNDTHLRMDFFVGLHKLLLLKDFNRESLLI